MDFDFSDDQEVLRSEARKFLDAHCPPTRVRAVLDDSARHFDAELWASLAAQGWTGLIVPEKYGGLGLSRTDLCVLAEELGRALAPVPFSSTVYLFAEALLIAGTESQQEKLSEIVSGQCIGCLALNEGAGEADLGSITAKVSGGKLTGTKVPVVDGLAATDALVWARDEAGAPRLYLVSLNEASVTRTALASLDPTRGLARVEFAGTPAELIGDPDLLDRLLDHAAVLLAFEQLGGADRCLELAIEYAKDRHAFGRAIGSQQAIKHKLADAYVHNQIARSNAYYGIWALDSGSEELKHAAAAARVAASTAFWYASKESIQTHGGIGFTWEADQHLFYRRAILLETAIGSPAHWRERLFDAVEKLFSETV